MLSTDKRVLRIRKKLITKLALKLLEKLPQCLKRLNAMAIGMLFLGVKNFEILTSPWHLLC